MTRKMVAVNVFFFVLIATLAGVAQQQNNKSAEWQAVEQAIGRSGQVQADGAYKVSFPRGDLKVTVEGVELKPALALGGWVAFSKPGADSMVMGDLVLTEEEIVPVMASLQNAGLQITALHNHLLHESPRVMYMHIGGHGAATKLASAVKEAMAQTKAPAPQPPAQAQQDIGIDTAGIQQALGHQGKVNGGVFQVSVPRKDSIHQGSTTAGAMKVPNSMGLATGLNFQPTGGGKAAITGDFVLIGSEVNPVIQALRSNGIQVTAVHSHMLDEQPRLFFMHFWANDDAVKLAKGLRAALDKTNSQQGKIISQRY
jgi:biotin operon repressor